MFQQDWHAEEYECYCTPDSETNNSPAKVINPTQPDTSSTWDVLGILGYLVFQNQWVPLTWDYLGCPRYPWIFSIQEYRKWVG